MSVVTDQPKSAAGAGGATVPAGGGATVLDGLEYLIAADTLIVSQKVELAEAIVGLETANKYMVKNGAGQHVYFAVEETAGRLPTCCSYLRAFNIRVMVRASPSILLVCPLLRVKTTVFLLLYNTFNLNFFVTQICEIRSRAEPS